MTSPEDIFNQLESEMEHDPKVHGAADDIIETYQALVWAASTFGNRVREEMVRTVHERFPRLAEIEQSEAHPEMLEELHERYFADDTEYAITIDMLAEAVTLAGRWLWRYLQAHQLDSLSLLVPLALKPGVRLWNFGSKSTLMNGEQVMTIAAEFHP